MKTPFQLSKIAPKILPIILLMVSFPLFAELPINKHLRDATKLNILRTPLYGELTNQESVKLSYELIAMENLAILFTLKLDLLARPYLKAGINIFKDDLIDMSLTPKFLTHFEDNDAPVEHIKINMSSISKDWVLKVKNNELNEIYLEAVQLLDAGELQNKNQNCLSRHFVESIARSLLNLEGHRTKALELNMEDPIKLIKKFLKVQIRSLSWAHSLDRRAFQFQRENIPLFCQDVPLIPYK
jgi:hypothetical protein